VISVYVTNYMREITDFEYVTWIMDDHVVRWKNRWVYPRGYASKFRKHMENASQVFVISPVMQEFYKKRFGITSEVVFGPADPVAEPVLELSGESATIRLCYFGSLWGWQADSLYLLAERLEEVNGILDIYSYNELPEGLQKQRIQKRAPIPGNEVIRKMRDYHGVVIPISFSDSLRNMSELNIATKMSECLASGTVVVAIGPEYSSMVKYLKQRKAAITITSPEIKEEWLQISRINRPGERRQLLENAAGVVNKETGMQPMIGKWQKAWENI
jgi:hypothetical protein